MSFLADTDFLLLLKSDLPMSCVCLANTKSASKCMLLVDAFIYQKEWDFLVFMHLLSWKEY